MTSPKPIISTTQKCKECHGKGEFDRPSYLIMQCSKCSGKGSITINIYKLEDFESCLCLNGIVATGSLCSKCMGTGYILPKDAVVKTISEIENHRFILMKEHNLNPKDKVVITHE